MPEIDAGADTPTEERPDSVAPAFHTVVVPAPTRDQRIALEAAAQALTTISFADVLNRKTLIQSLSPEHAMTLRELDQAFQPAAAIEGLTGFIDRLELARLTAMKNWLSYENGSRQYPTLLEMSRESLAKIATALRTYDPAKIWRDYNFQSFGRTSWDIENVGPLEARIYDLELKAYQAEKSGEPGEANRFTREATTLTRRIGELIKISPDRDSRAWIVVK